MIVVSDTSPINNLAAINQLHLLYQLYGTVFIPESVYRELTDLSFPVAGATEVQTFDWIQIRSVTDRAVVEAPRNELRAPCDEAKYLLILKKKGSPLVAQLAI